jgi:hypothetical protein
MQGAGLEEPAGQNRDGHSLGLGDYRGRAST